MNAGSPQGFSFKRIIAKLYIDRSIDTGIAPPSWVSARCEQDVALAEYQRRARLLVEQLRMQADAWAGSQLEISEQRAADKNPTSAESLPGMSLSSLRSAANSYVPSSSEQLQGDARAWRLLVAAASLLLAVGAWFAWGELGSHKSEPNREQQTQSKAAGSLAEASRGSGGQPDIVRDDTGEWEQDHKADWRPLIASAAATEEVFRRVSSGSRRLLRRTLASTTELGLDAPLVRVEEAGEELRMRGAKLRQSMNRMSEVVYRFIVADRQLE